MNGILRLVTAAAVLTLSLVPLSAQDCLFKTKNDDTFKQALKAFHEPMAAVIHGPAEKGDFSQVGAKAEELSKLRDRILSANLPEKLAGRCPEISAKALELSKAVDTLASQSKAKAPAVAMSRALEDVHIAYRNLNTAITTLEDLLDAFHTVLHPLWHEAYPAKNVAGIKAEIPKLKVRAKLIASTAEASVPAKSAGAKKLVETVTTLEEAGSANDDLAILEALRIVHDTYEQLAEGQH